VRPEELVVEATEHLRAQLPGRLAAIDAHYGPALTRAGDPVPLAAPDSMPGSSPLEGERYIAGGWDLIPTDWHPTVEVAIAETTSEDFDLAQHRATSLVPIMVVVHCHHPEYGVLWRLMYRYAQAVSEVLSMRGVVDQGESASRRIVQRFAITLDETLREYPVWEARPLVTAWIECDTPAWTP
jgi:hypothetical protein